jgi:hypothetical protein
MQRRTERRIYWSQNHGVVDDMRVGIMQPYFFPYLGYFDLIAATDRWIVGDTAQYIRHGWVNRNRILHPASGWQYIIVPTKKHPHEAPISSVEVSNGVDWRARILGQIQHYRKKAPFYEPTMQLVRDCLSTPETSLSRLNVHALERVCSHLRLRFDYAYLSELDLPLGPVEAPGDRALRIAQALGAREYVNPPGGAGLYDAARFTEAGVKLTIRQLVDFRYPCGGYQFEPLLSVIDVLMWNPPSAIRDFLHSLQQPERHQDGYAHGRVPPDTRVVGVPGEVASTGEG